MPLTEIILDFNTLRGTKPRILTPKRYDDHPRHFHLGVPPRARLLGAKLAPSGAHGSWPREILLSP